MNQKSLQIKTLCPHWQRSKWMSKKKLEEFVKYLESSQGAGQLVTQLNLQVLSLKPANKERVYSRFQSENTIYCPLLMSSQVCIIGYLGSRVLELEEAGGMRELDMYFSLPRRLG